MIGHTVRIAAAFAVFESCFDFVSGFFNRAVASPMHTATTRPTVPLEYTTCLRINRVVGWG